MSTHHVRYIYFYKQMQTFGLGHNLQIKLKRQNGVVNSLLFTNVNLPFEKASIRLHINAKTYLPV